MSLRETLKQWLDMLAYGASQTEPRPGTPPAAIRYFPDHEIDPAAAKDGPGSDRREISDDPNDSPRRADGR